MSHAEVYPEMNIASLYWREPSANPRGFLGGLRNRMHLVTFIDRRGVPGREEGGRDRVVRGNIVER